MDRPERAARVGVDVGGTFTDLVALRAGRLFSAKVRSVPRDQSLAVMLAIDSSGVPADEIALVAHGTTVATNALLERRGARTALVTTEGFRDVIEIGRQDRAALYDLTATRPQALVPRELRFTVRERVGPRGVRSELDEASLQELIEKLRQVEIDAVAVCLLFSFAHPEHERRVSAAIREALPGLYVASSSEVLPEFREYERFATTAANAYLGPVLTSYLDRLDERLRALGIPPPVVMQSSGGVADLTGAAKRASTCVLSGPAAGVVAAAWVAGESGFSDLLTFDMGGTSTDVSLVLGGEVQLTTGSVVAGVPIKHPMVDVHTVSAGGGSIAWVDSGHALRVGPRSAGGDPGPVCYGLGGAEVTVTDADLVLGYLRDGARLGGEIVLSKALAEDALTRLAAELGLDSVAAAAGVTVVAEAEMSRALRVISIERGIDPRDLTLVAFGGAGGVHACSLAEELGVATVVFPRAGGVLSALGLAVCDLRRDDVRAFFAPLDDLAAAEVERVFDELEQAARNDLPEAVCRRFADVRYAGQSFELTVPVTLLESLAPSFHAAHLQRYGYELSDLSVAELVAVRVSAVTSIPRPSLGAPATPPDGSAGRVAAGPTGGSRAAYFDRSWLETTVFDISDLQLGDRLTGPAIVELPEATCVVRPGWTAILDRNGALVMTHPHWDAVGTREALAAPGAAAR
jgi:N-methylhydantoinase A